MYGIEQGEITLARHAINPLDAVSFERSDNEIGSAHEQFPSGSACSCRVTGILSSMPEALEPCS